MVNKKRKIIFDKFEGKCAYCGCDLCKYWQVDHFLPLERNILTGGCKYPERKKLENLMPSCASCNNYKSSHSIEEFRRIISELRKQLMLSSQYKISLRYGLIKENDINVKFYYEANK